jgi:hypothetical protein
MRPRSSLWKWPVVTTAGLLAVLTLGTETLPRPLVAMLPLSVAAACFSTLFAHMLSRR